ncbi:MAG TPA: cytochrome c oxidase subunit 3 family protein [Thermoguttaceae bacterium]
MTDEHHTIAESSHAGEHEPFLAHHFDTHAQQLNAGKLGMWIFLLTEILLFSGLFLIYTVYRSHHPEIFVWAHQFLDKTLGGVNTVVLIASSFTMAWAVRCAQKNQRRGSIVLLVLTWFCACGFLGIKYVEYKHKWQDGLLWASRFKPNEHEIEAIQKHYPDPGHVASDVENAPRNAGIFFSIYFAMTGLHGLHVLAGMIAIGWVLRRSIRGDFNSQYFGPVDFVGLYWHLVDLIWIYLFPLLYLIH